MPNLHFTLGENLGIQLAEIAKEHILDYRLDKANSLWVDSFGCPEDLAERLTAGELVVVVDDPEKCLVNVTERDNLSNERRKEYPRITLPEIYRLIDKNFQSPRDEDEGHVFYDLRGCISEVNRLIATNNPLDIDAHIAGEFCQLFPEWFPKGVTLYGTLSVHPRVLVNQMFNSDGDEFMDKFESFLIDITNINGWRYTDSRKVHKILWILRLCKRVLTMEDKFMELEDFAIKFLHGDPHHKNVTERHINEIREVFQTWHMWCSSVEDGQLTVVNEEFAKEANSMFDEYFAGLKNIDKMSKDFQPVEITDKYDAGWLAPDGKFFGLNGSSGNFLHIAIADNLMDYYGYERPDDFEFSVDAFIAKQGFVKIHHDWVLYEGYDCVMTDKPVELTRAQIKAIAEYGRKCYNGRLSFGYDKKRKTIEEFELMDQEELADLLGV